MSGLATLEQLMAEFEEELRRGPRRYPIVRAGEREPIPFLVRLSVFKRDGNHCRECGSWYPNHAGYLELDHMLPWSAGGGDESTNLRTLCVGCNQRRSNWNDGAHQSRVLPTTWWCFDCWCHPDEEYRRREEDWEFDSIPRMYRSQWRNGIDLAAVPFVIEPNEPAFCAWCGCIGWTDTYFDAANQNRLTGMCGDYPALEADVNQAKVRELASGEGGNG